MKIKEASSRGVSNYTYYLRTPSLSLPPQLKRENYPKNLLKRKKKNTNPLKKKDIKRTTTMTKR